MRRELAALVARSPFGQAAAWPVVETVQGDGQCVEVLAPAPGPGRASAPRRPSELALRIADELGVTGLLAVELFETDGTASWSSTSWRCARTTPGTGRSRARARRSSSSTCVRCWTTRWARRTPTAPAVVMANVLGAAAPGGMSVDERLHHLFARFPDVKVHLYGKAERPARKVGHVTALGDRHGRGARDGRRWPPSWLSDGGVGRRVVAVHADARATASTEEGGVRCLSRWSA